MSCLPELWHSTASPPYVELGKMLASRVALPAPLQSPWPLPGATWWFANGHATVLSYCGWGG